MMSACARATTAQESAYRIDYPLAFARSTRVVAFDATAEEIVRSVAAEGEWGQAQFYRASETGDGLVRINGESRRMETEIENSDSVIMVATNGIGGEAVAAVGQACLERSIMTAGLLMVDEGALTGETLSAIRPYARILLVPADRDDLLHLLRAIRA